MWKPLPPSVDVKLRPKTRFYADHNVRALLISLLRSDGIDVVTAAERHKEGASDEEHFAEAKRLKRLLLTHDRDFLDRRRFSTRGGTGIVVMDGGDGSLTRLIQVYRFLLLMRRGHDQWTTTIMEIGLDGSVRCRWWEKSLGTDVEERYKLGTHSVFVWDGDENSDKPPKDTRKRRRRR